jgi:hypothetical protein
MRLRLLTLVCLGLVPLASQAAEPDLSAVLQVMGYGYKVKVSVNGTDIGIEGGKSEGRRLFNKGHAMAAKAAPAIRARNFMLVPGVNEFSIEYRKVGSQPGDKLEITLEAEGYPEPLLRLVSTTKASDKLTVKVDVAPKAPANFKPTVILDAK